MDIQEFRERLEKSWSRETSEDPEGWSKDNPAYRQCLISAMIFQDNFGGDIIQGKVGGTQPYYWNRLADGTEIELTHSQLPAGIVVPEGKVRPRAAIERALRASRPDVLEKYEILKKRTDEAKGGLKRGVTI